MTLLHSSICDKHIITDGEQSEELVILHVHQ